MQSIENAPLLEHWHRLLNERGDSLAVIDCAMGTRHSFADIEALTTAMERQLRPILAKQRTADEPPPANDILANTAHPAPVVLLSLPNGARWLAAYLAVHRCGAVIAPVEPGVGTRYPMPQCLHNVVARIDSDDIVALAPIAAHIPVQHVRQAAFVPHLIKLTSGSTGQPQALRFSEANMIADGLNIIATMGLHPQSLNYAAIPLGHSYGLGNLVLPFFLQGTAIVCASGILPNIVASEIATHRATFFPAVPTLIRALCVAQAAAQKLASLERLISAGSVLPPELARAFEAAYGKRIHNFYGSSETGGICFDTSGEATLSGQSLGHALANVLVDTDAQGRVRVQSDACTPDLVDAQGRIVLEDCGAVLDSGQLRLEGRAGRMLKIGARRLDLSAWEAQARKLPQVEDAFSCASVRANQEAALCVALQTKLPAAELRKQLNHIFPRWQQPARLLCLAAFPHTARGKTDTAALRALLAAEQR